eukprot:gene3838-4430_t
MKTVQHQSSSSGTTTLIKSGSPSCGGALEDSSKIRLRTTTASSAITTQNSNSNNNRIVQPSTRLHSRSQSHTNGTFFHLNGYSGSSRSGRSKHNSSTIEGDKLTAQPSDFSLLLVDFDTRSRQSLQEWLISCDYTNLHCANNLSELTASMTSTFDMIIYDTSADTDIQSLTKTPILYIIDRMEIAHFLARPGYHFLSKPLSKTMFINQVKYVVESRLRQDRLKSLESIVGSKDREIEVLKLRNSQLLILNKRINKAMEPPIEAITNSLSTILVDSSLSNSPVKRELENILYLITSNNDLYGTAVNELLNQDINPIAKSILQMYTNPTFRSKDELTPCQVEFDTQNVEPLKVWGYNPFVPNEDQLVSSLLNMFLYYQMPEKLGITTSTLTLFILQLAEKTASTTSATPITSSHEDRVFLLELILHAADISNTAKPWDISLDWCERINKESFIQGRLEKQKNIPVTDWMDESKTTVAKNSVNFMLYICEPFFVMMSEFFPQTIECTKMLKSNIERWVEIMAATSPASGSSDDDIDSLSSSSL